MDVIAWYWKMALCAVVAMWLLWFCRKQKQVTLSGTLRCREHLSLGGMGLTWICLGHQHFLIAKTKEHIAMVPVNNPEDTSPILPTERNTRISHSAVAFKGGPPIHTATPSPPVSITTDDESMPQNADAKA